MCQISINHQQKASRRWRLHWRKTLRTFIGWDLTVVGSAINDDLADLYRVTAQQFALSYWQVGASIEEAMKAWDAYLPDKRFDSYGDESFSIRPPRSLANTEALLAIPDTEFQTFTEFQRSSLLTGFASIADPLGTTSGALGTPGSEALKRCLHDISITTKQ
jgi:hypothetical protein